MKPACHITPAQLQVLQGFGGAGQVQLKVRTCADETHTVALAAIPADQVLVPRELLEELLEEAKDGAAHKGEYLSKKYGEPELFAKFDILLHP